jgi:hypothetical protein
MRSTCPSRGCSAIKKPEIIPFNLFMKAAMLRDISLRSKCRLLWNSSMCRLFYAISQRRMVCTRNKWSENFILQPASVSGPLSLATSYLFNRSQTNMQLTLSKFYSPTDAQLDSVKNNFKFALKLTLKGCYMFRCEKHHPRGAHYLSLAKFTIVKMS